MTNSQVLSLRISNKDLASCLLFEKLLKGSNGDKLSSCISLLISSTTLLLKDSKKIPNLDEYQAKEIIEDFLRSIGRSKIGKKEVLQKGKEIERSIFQAKEVKEAFSPSSYTPTIPLEEEEEITDNELIDKFHEEVEREVEAIQMEDELNLLKSIFINPK